MELNRFEKANVKRIFNTTKTLRNKKVRIITAIEAKNKELEAVESEIKEWEAPIITKYGKTSEEILKAMGEPVVEVVEAKEEEVYNEEVTPIEAETANN